MTDVVPFYVVVFFIQKNAHIITLIACYIIYIHKSIFICLPVQLLCKKIVKLKHSHYLDCQLPLVKRIDALLCPISGATIHLFIQFHSLTYRELYSFFDIFIVPYHVRRREETREIRKCEK